MSDNSRHSDDPIAPANNDETNGTVIDTAPVEATQTAVTVTDVEARPDTMARPEQAGSQAVDRGELEAAVDDRIVRTASEPATRIDIDSRTSTQPAPSVDDEEGHHETTLITPPTTASRRADNGDRSDDDRPTRRVRFATGQHPEAQTRPAYDHGTVELGDQLPTQDKQTQIADTRRDRPLAVPAPISGTPIVRPLLQPREKVALLVAVGLGLVAMMIAYVIGRLG